MKALYISITMLFLFAVPAFAQQTGDCNLAERSLIGKILDNISMLKPGETVKSQTWVIECAAIGSRPYRLEMLIVASPESASKSGNVEILSYRVRHEYQPQDGNGIRYNYVTATVVDGLVRRITWRKLPEF